MSSRHTEKEKSTAPASSNIAYLVVSMVILLLGIVFALQNADETKVTFLIWEFKSSRAIVLFITFFTGIIIGVFTSLANLMRKDRIIKRQVKDIEKLQNRVDALENEVEQKGNSYSS